MMNSLFDTCLIRILYVVLQTQDASCIMRMYACNTLGNLDSTSDGCPRVPYVV